MVLNPIGGYAGRFFRVDLSEGEVTEEKLDEAMLRKYVGGTGLGAKFLYEEVPPRVGCSDPENRLILASGPFGGTKVAGSGTFSVVTKGCQTNGAVSSQANGFLGAYLKFSGADGLIIQGAAEKLSYLYVHDGKVEIKDAGYLAGKDTWEIKELIQEELGKKKGELSVFGIGPAGENMVKFAAIAGDEGHVVAHNGVGMVMGSKKLKAVVAAKGKGSIGVADKEKVSTLARDLFEQVKSDPLGSNLYKWGTSNLYTAAEAGGYLPVKNYTTNIFPEHEKFMGEHVRSRFEIKLNPCWACRMNHCHIMTVTEGPYAGYVGEEPEYEQWAAWGSLIGQNDPGAAMVLSNEVDRLGMDTNEAGWVIAWVMECYEKGIFTKKETDGLEMVWGNVEAARAMLRKIAWREGFGDILAEGVMRAAQRVGGEAANFAVYTKKGASPRGHDHRARWPEMLDTATSNTGTIETGPARHPDEIGLPTKIDPFSPEEVPMMLAKMKGKLTFTDCLGVCRFTTTTYLKHACEVLSAITGWDFTVEEAMKVGERLVNVLRVFNIKHGLTPDLEAPSPRYGSAPVDGPWKGKSVALVWDSMVRRYYELMGWYPETGEPLPETLKNLGLEHLITDLKSR